jgi:hypothetical protein
VECTPVKHGNPLAKTSSRWQEGYRIEKVA